jgi:hypothetical protein
MPPTATKREKRNMDYNAFKCFPTLCGCLKSPFIGAEHQLAKTPKLSRIRTTHVGTKPTPKRSQISGADKSKYNLENNS